MPMRSGGLTWRAQPTCQHTQLLLHARMLTDAGSFRLKNIRPRDAGARLSSLGGSKLTQNRGVRPGGSGRRCGAALVRDGHARRAQGQSAGCPAAEGEWETEAQGPASVSGNAAAVEVNGIVLVSSGTPGGRMRIPVGLAAKPARCQVSLGVAKCRSEANAAALALHARCERNRDRDQPARDRREEAEDRLEKGGNLSIEADLRKLETDSS